MEEMQKKLSTYLKYLEVDPENSLLCIQVGDLYHQGGEFAKAREHFDRAIALKPQNSVGHSRLGGVLLSENQFDQAIQSLEEALAFGDQDGALKYNYALALYCAKRFSEAQCIFNALRGERERFPDLAFYHVSCLHNDDKNPEAIVQAEEYLSEKEDSKLKGYLSLIRMDNFDMALAARDAEEVLEKDPSNADAATVLGNLAIEDQDILKATELFELVTKREPDSQRGWQGKGLVALLSRDYDGAQKFFEKTIEIDPEQVGNFNTLGWTHIIKNDFYKAEQIFRKGVERNRNNSEVHGGLSVALVFQNKLDEAKREADLALKLDRASFGGIYAKSIMLQLRGKEKIASKLLGGMLDAPLGDGKPSLMDHLIKYESRNGHSLK